MLWDPGSNGAENGSDSPQAAAKLYEMPSWSALTYDLTYSLDGKRLLLRTGHENELGHTVDHREPFWLTYDRIEGAEAPFLLMTWGESFYYRPE